MGGVSPWQDERRRSLILSNRLPILVKARDWNFFMLQSFANQPKSAEAGLSAPKFDLPEKMSPGKCSWMKRELGGTYGSLQLAPIGKLYPSRWTGIAILNRKAGAAAVTILSACYNVESTLGGG